MTNDTRDLLARAIEDYAAGAGHELLANYSGRFMHGAPCVGIVTEDMPGAIAGIAMRVMELLQDTDTIGERDAEAIMSAFDGCRCDSMGRDYVVYWPDLRQRANIA